MAREIRALIIEGALFGDLEGHRRVLNDLLASYPGVILVGFGDEQHREDDMRWYSSGSASDQVEQALTDLFYSEDSIEFSDVALVTHCGHIAVIGLDLRVGRVHYLGDKASSKVEEYLRENPGAEGILVVRKVIGVDVAGSVAA